MNFLLDIIYTSRDNPFGEKLAFGATTVLIGMLAVFSVLIIIWICLVGLKFFLHDIPAQRKAEKASKLVEPAPAPVSAPTASSNDEIVAVIAAAIAQAESEESGLKFRVVSFKRK